MKHSLIAVLAAGFAASTLGLLTFPLTAQPEGVPTAQPEVPAQPQAIPVPDGPVVATQELEGGLVIEDLKIGHGYEVKEHGAVVAHYHGTRQSDGVIFDSSFQRGEPVAFPLDGVIEGWQKGVPGMKIGGVRRLTIPSAMGYGESGAGADIPPNTNLVFVIELIDALQIEDLVVGEGEEAGMQCVAVTHHLITDQEGKTIEEVKGVPYIWFPGELQGVQMGLTGMKVGGKRKILIPAMMNVSPPQAMSERPQNVPMTIELDLIAVRNLGGR